MWHSWCLIHPLLFDYRSYSELQNLQPRIHVLHLCALEFYGKLLEYSKLSSNSPLSSSTLLTVHIKFTLFLFSASRVEIDIYVSVATVIYLVFADFCKEDMSLV